MAVVDEYARERGFTLSPLDETTQPYVVFQAQRCRAMISAAIAAQWLDKTRTVTLDVAETGLFQAVAGTSSDGEQDFIVLHYGLFNVIFQLFSLLVESPYVFPEIISPDPRLFSTSFTKKRSVQDLRGALTEDLGVGTHETRAEFVRLLATTALDFVVLHELGHIRNGHTQWVKSKTGVSVIEEKRRPPDDHPFDSVVLEVDADSFAFMQLLNQFIVPKDTWEEREHGIKALCFSVYCVFRLMDEREVRSISDFSLVSHPPAIYRQLNSIGLGLQEVTKMDPLAEGIYARAANAAMAEAERAFSQFGIVPRNPMTRGSSVLSLEYLHEHEKAWARIRPELMALRRGGVLAVENPNRVLR